MTADPQSNQADSQSEEIHRLAAARCDGSLTGEDRERLQRILVSSESARQCYVDYFEIHADVAWRVQARSAVAPLFIDETPPGNDPTGATVPVAVNKASLVRRVIGSGYGSLAACVIVAASSVFAYRALDAEERPTSPVAKITAASKSGRWFVIDDRVHDGRRSAFAGDEVCVAGGVVEVSFADGTSVTVAAPATLTPLTASSAKVLRGSIRARAEEGSDGFVVETPTARVVDLGTTFGVGVSDDATTRVAVFDGEVDVLPITPAIHRGPTPSIAPTRLRLGEGIELADGGAVRPLMSIMSNWFPIPDHQGRFPVIGDSVISSVGDNLPTEAGRRSFYEIVADGMQEDARAYADRGYHQWNGVTSSGLPSYLVGGDYVRMFNNRKFAEDFELYVTIKQPATLYLLFDDRLPAPAWLTSRFEDTGDDVGLDEGPHVFESGRFLDRDGPGAGPGVSIDYVHSVWKQVVGTPDTVVCGGIDAEGMEGTDYVMYGVVAVPLVVESVGLH